MPNIHFECTALKKSDCHLWVTLSKKKRCGDCDGVDDPDFAKNYCGGCPDEKPRCKYKKKGVCNSSLAKAHAMLAELRKLGVEVEIK
jgi:hypothetical protein